VKTDHYRVLQVHPEADQQTIQAAYRSLSRRMHPDKNQDRREWAEGRTQALNAAYSVLGDVQKRLAFDRQREQAAESRSAGARRPERGGASFGAARVSEAGEYSATVASLRRMEEDLFRVKQENHTLRKQCEELAAQVANRDKQLVGLQGRLEQFDAQRRSAEKALGVAEKQGDILRGKLGEQPAPKAPPPTVTRTSSRVTRTRSDAGPTARSTSGARRPAPPTAAKARAQRNVDLPGGQMTMGYVRVTGGQFRMGSDTGDPQEQPAHDVQVDGFWMSATLVTARQYAIFLRSNPRWSRRSAMPGRHADYLRGFQGDTPPNGRENSPVVYVDWAAAAAFSEWAGAALPTEAQWEYAAQGGQAHRYGTRDGTLHSRLANYGGAAGAVTDVRKHSPNPYGLYDMAGNAWEWCADEYDEAFYTSAEAAEPNPVAGERLTFVEEEWAGQDADGRRSIRGGSWQSLSADVRVAARAYQTASLPTAFCGFRCVMRDDA